MALAACAVPLERYEAGRYADAAIAARSAGNYALARSNWAKAIAHAQLGAGRTRELAIAYYEYGRSSGIICDWDEANRGLQRSLELDRSVNGPVHMSLIELARMNLDRGHYEAARGYFEQANDLYEAMSAETRDPIGYAQFLDEYSLALDRTGAHDKAAPFRARAQQLRATFPKGESHSERTPYGTQCGTS